jgi:hypothetical protein
MELNNAVDSLKNAEYRQPAALAGRSDYAISSGTRMTEIDKGPPNFADAATWAWAVETTSKPELLDGISFQISRVTIQQITDGTSQTLMIGEKFIPPRNYENGKDAGDNETWCTGWNNDNFRIMYGKQFSIGGAFSVDPPLPDSDEDVTGLKPQVPTADRFGSAHPSVWVAAYCDGSTHAMSYDADPEMLRRLASRHDGLNLDAGGL